MIEVLGVFVFSIYESEISKGVLNCLSEKPAGDF